MNPSRIDLTVWNDGARVQVDGVLLGWFKDEVAAVSAALERLLMLSAELADLRQLGEVTIRTERKREYARVKVQAFRRATRVKCVGNNRRVVRLPGTFGKPWVSA